MAPLSLRIVQDDGVVTRKFKLDANMTVAEATKIVEEKSNLPPEAKAYGLFLRSLDSDLTGIWLEHDKKLSDYLLRDGDQLDYRSKMRNLKVRMLDDAVKTFQVDQSKMVSDLMFSICAKIGITNHEEYGMCIDEAEEDESKEKQAAGQTGTLTLKKRSKLEERDQEFEQLSKKLKTDDNVDWVDSHKTLSEACIAPTQTLLLKRRLFYSDRNVDSRDPVQLNLLYLQARDNILNSRHPITVGKAVEFAGIQCQIQFGDYNEEKHKTGFIENLSEYLPEQYCSAWGMEKKILKEYSTRIGLAELDAKHLYTKTAREMPTYGVTFFLVKEKQKGKKKLVPRLLGINADAILRLDETTKEVVQTWPLTHVKTYHAGKGETFTLNFGDYTDKEYSVKTRDAFRIRDILEGYIDLIRKRMLANYNMAATEHGYIGQENIASGQASVIQHIPNNPSAAVTHSYVGPSSVMEYEPGQVASQGSQAASAQHFLVNEMKNSQQQGVLQAEVGMRKNDMGIPFTRRLNRLNSNSVQIVTLLSEPSRAHLEDSKKIVEKMTADLPTIREGVLNTIAKQTSEEEKKKLQDQLKELEELLKTLSESTDPNGANPAEAEDAAKRLASLSTEMYFAIAPETRRRSKVLSKSRASFIADEKTERTLHRASFIAACATASHALDSAAELADERYVGDALTPDKVAELERSAVDKLGKINAAIALHMLAHADPQNVDYSAAVTSMNTLHELVPDLARDAQALASLRDGKDRSALINDIKELCCAAKRICALSGADQPEKLQEASVRYADVAGRLVYVFGRRGGKQRADKENEILGLADTVVDKASALLDSTQALTGQAAAEPAAGDVNNAGARLATDAKTLHAQAVLNSPTIDEPHCQSALTAASEALSSSAQRLAASWKPLVEPPSRHVVGEKLHHQTMDLAKALDDLRSAYSPADSLSQNAQSKSKPGDEAQRLKFINSLSRVGGNWKAAEDDLNKPLSCSVSAAEALEAERRLAGRVAQLNASLAALLAATGDRENPDYATAESAAAVINDLMPEIIKDAKIASANKDPASKAALLDDIRALCAASKNICASAYGEPDALNDALVQYTGASGKLTYVCNRRANPDRESKIIDATSAACAQAGALLSRVQSLAEREGGPVGAGLDARGAELANAAQALLTAAQVTASSISDPRCQSSLSSAIARVSAASEALEAAWTPLQARPEHEAGLQGLRAARRQLEQRIGELRAACLIPDLDVEESQTSGQSTLDGPQQRQKLQFIAKMRGANEKLTEAQKELNKPATPAKGSDAGAVKQRLADSLEQLNAAVAALLAATADRENSDYAKAEQAAETISKLMPQLIKDTKTVGATADEPARAAMLAEIRALCNASQGICASAYGQDDTQQNLNDAVSKFADASGKLVFVANPRRSAQKNNEVVKLANGVCADTAALAPAVMTLAAGAGGERGRGLDARAGGLAGAARGLQRSAQVLSPSLPARSSQEALLSSVEQTSEAAQRLAAALSPLRSEAGAGAGAQAQQAMNALRRIDEKLDALRVACGAGEGADSHELQKLQLIKTVEATKEKWAEAEKELQKPRRASQGHSEDAEATRARLSARLAALDAAVARLLAAAADGENPRYADTEKSVKTISELLPQIIQDSKSVSGSKDEAVRAAMLAEIKALCDASQAVCASSYGEDPQVLNDAVSKFAKASGKLVFVVNPRKNTLKHNEVVDLANAVCGEASSLLTGVQSLAEEVDGSEAEELDSRGARLADQINNLLQTVTLTAPSLSSPECRSALVSSADEVSRSAHQLSATVAPLQTHPTHGAKAKDTVQALKRLEDKLDELRKACGPSDLDGQEQQKLHLIKTVESTKGKFADAQKELSKPVTAARASDVGAVESRLTARLAALDAAVASLLAATADYDKPQYAEAEKSVKTISELLPQIVQDSKTVSGSKEEPARAAMLAEIKALCDASQHVCASSYGEDPQAKSDAVSKFADASGKLVFVINPRKSPQKHNEVVNQANAVSGEASALLKGVQQLAKAVSGPQGHELDAQGARLADHTNNLMQTVKVTAPSSSSPECQAALVSSAAGVSQAARQLAATVAPLQQHPTHGPQAKDTTQALKRLEDKLNKFKTACVAPEADCKDSQEEHKLQLIKTIESTQGKFAEARKELNKPVTGARSSDVSALESRLSARLSALHAAVAALLAATADSDKPHYAEIEKSVKTISDELPHIVQETKTVSASKDEPARAAILAEIKALCDASQAVCASSYGQDPKGLNDAVSKLADASGKLVFVVKPRKSPQKHNEIVHQANDVCGEASGLLTGVQKLTKGLDAKQAQELDIQGARLADQTNNLLQTIKITAPSLSSPECRSALVSSADGVSVAARQLTETVAPLQQHPTQGSQAKETIHALNRLDDKLKKLKTICEEPDVVDSQVSTEQQKLQFIKAVEATMDKFAVVHKELNKPVPVSRASDVAALESRLSARLAALNAAVAALLAATADTENPQYAEAEKSVKTISELLPQIVQDSKTVSGSKEEPARAAMLAEIRALCDASQAVCASSYGEDPQGLNDAVSKFADASGKLVFVVNPRKTPQKHNEIIDQANAVCGDASSLLMGVHQLTKGLDVGRAQELDIQGARLADQTNNLLQTVKITAPSLSSPVCRSALVSSADGVSQVARQLAATVESLQHHPTHASQAKETIHALKKLDDKLNKLKKICEAPDVDSEVSPKEQKLQFIKTVEATKDKFAIIHEELNKPVTLARDSNVAALESRLSARLAALDAAVAALLAATADPDKPQYAEAEKSIKTISELLPHIVQDSKTVSAGKDEQVRAAMLADIKALCDASQAVCASSYGEDSKGMPDAVSKFADASGKLVFVINPRKNPQKHNEIVHLANAVCGESAALLSGVQTLSEDVGGSQGQELDVQGARLADQTQNFLQTVQVTAPSLSSPSCRGALALSTERVSRAARGLGATVAPLQTHPDHGGKANNTLQALQRLHNKLAAIKFACETPNPRASQDLSQKELKLMFIKTVEATNGKWADVEKELKKPVTPAREDVSVVQSRLAHRLAALDAAVAALLAATADREKPNFMEAEKSAKTITDLLPHVIQDSKTVSASKEAPERAAMLADIKSLCDASQAVCASSYSKDPQALNDAVAKFSNASGKLVYVANPRTNTKKEREVIEHAGEACGTAAALLSGVQQLAEGVGGAQGRELDAVGGRVADGAQNLLYSAQITGSSLSYPESRIALLSSINNLSHSASQLSHSLSEATADGKHNAEADKLSSALKRLQDQLHLLRKICNASDAIPSPTGRQPPPLPSSRPPSMHAASNRRSAAYDAQDFLARMRAEEGRLNAPAVVGGVNKVPPPAPPARPSEDDKLRPLFVKSLEDAQDVIKKHESSLMKQCRAESGVGPALSQRDMLQRQARLQRNIAQAGLEVAGLVTANYADKIDYTSASKSTKALPELMTNIVQDGTQLSDNLNDMARKAFLYDMLQMCDAARKICDAAGTDRQKLNDAAVHFGDTSTKLLYVVSSDVDPALEKEIISRTKAIGDSASRLALDAANVASAAGAGAGGGAASPVQGICDAGTACVDAAGKLVYTAKLTAPSIHEVSCQEALVASADTLSAKLRSFADSWKPLESDQKQAKTISHLSAEAANLQSILQGLRSDVKEGNIGRRRELEQLVIEDTPLRQLTVKILDEAKVHAESPSLPAPQKIAYAAYADKLTEALRALDLSNARCKKTPHDTDRRRDLEAAIQNLQMILLQSRPTRGEKGQTNIVDLMDFMEELSAEAKSLSSAASASQVPTPQDKRTLEEIREQCDTMETKANQLLRGEVASDLEFNDLFDQFGQECDDVIKQITTEVKRMEDIKAKKILHSHVLTLSESCNMLRFATKSGISTEACATLDGTLDELDDIEERVITSIVQEATPGVMRRAKLAPSSVHSTATVNLCREVTSSPTGVSSAAVTAYVADATTRADASDPDEHNRLKKHLYKLVHLLKTLTVTSSKRAATWQPVDGPETARITDQILQEIYNPESKFGAKTDEKKQKILDDDITNLLIPSAPKILGDHKQQEVKLTQLAGELSTKCGALTEPSPAALGSAARAAANCARELDSIARGAHVTDPVQRRKIDEAAKEMSFCTYNVLKTAESVCLEPKNTGLRRRLADALQNLNHSIDKLVWRASPAAPLSRQCGALSRGAAAQLASLRPRPHSAATFHHTCDIIAQQQDNIFKLKNDDPMPRKEFMQNLDDIGTAVRNSVDGAAHCAYYIAVSEQHKDLAKTGVVDVPKIQLALEAIQDSCMAIVGSTQYEQAKEQKDDLHKRVLDFSNALDQAQMQVKDSDAKKTLARAKTCVNEAAENLVQGLQRQTSMDKVTPRAVDLLEAVSRAHGMVEQTPLVPEVGHMNKDTKDKCDEVINQSKTLLTHTLALLKDVNEAPEEPELMTWVTFNTDRKKLLDAYDALLKSVRRNGHRVGIYDKAPEEEKEVTKKSYIETQVDLANKWLRSSVCKTEVKVIGQQAARNVVDMARQMSEELKGSEREEVRNVIAETEELLSECSKKYDHEKNSLLMDRLKELRKCIQRGVVTRVVEDFIEAEAPLEDLDLLTGVETDESKRKFILERKIASLLAQLGRVTKTARFVANASQQQSVGVELTRSSEQTELLAPMLVKAAQQRIDQPDDQEVIDKYKALLAQYAESLSQVRDLCDRAVDPMEFVQAAGDTMQRMREEVAQSNSDVQKCAHTSQALTKLANRVINVSMHSNAVASDPELQKALIAAKQRLHAVTPAPDTRASRLPDWRDTTAEILRATGDVESALGGENIFKKEPTTANQPIYSVARDLHESVREWSSRDNEIVAVARRVAVLMARLSEYMETDKKDALIVTSKSIVVESQEVAELAKKLAHECSDVRIKTNLLQTCERIPTISGQLKMLTTVKASSLGQQGVEADKEAMDMLVGNAQSLMLSIQEVVKAAASASVKIMSQRGPRLRWVRKNYY